VGGVAPGFSLVDNSLIQTIHGGGGWAQVSAQLASRLTLNIFGGMQDNQVSNLQYGDIIQNSSYAGNLMYRISPNVIISFEALQARTRLLSEEEQIRNRYDLALAYLF
jgi:hypothetical protein